MPWSRNSRAIPLLPLWAVWPVQSLSSCTRVHITFFYVRIFRPRKTVRLISSMISRRKSATQGLTFKLNTSDVTSTTANLKHAAKRFKHWYCTCFPVRTSFKRLLHKGTVRSRTRVFDLLVLAEILSYVGYSESKYRLRISLAHPRDCHFAHVQ